MIFRTFRRTRGIRWVVSALSGDGQAFRVGGCPLLGLTTGGYGSRGARRLANFVATKLTLSCDAVELPFTGTGSRPGAAGREGQLSGMSLLSN